MYRIKDFYNKKIYSIQGKKLGVIKDIYLDFNAGVILGFEVNSYSFSNKKNYLDISDIISVNDEVICNELKKGKGLKFSDIKDLEVINKDGDIKGEVEDLIIDKDSYKIKGIILGIGIVDRMIGGKEVILVQKCVLGDDFIVYLGGAGVKVRNLPHNLNKDVYYKKA